MDEVPETATPRRAAGLSGFIQAAWGSRGPLAASLLPLAALHGWIVRLRRALYRRGWKASGRLAAPVVVVGNLIVGGAGKTPTVIATVDILRRHGWQPGIVSRGYGGDHRGALEVDATTPARACGDEPLLMHRRTGAPTVVAADRVAAGRLLLARHPEVDIVVADDGLQHLALARDVQILVFDERGAGNGWLLPAGPLREPLPRRLPPRSLVVYNAPAASTPLPGFRATAGLRGLWTLADWQRGAAHAGRASDERLASLRSGPVLVAAGLGRPERFHAMLRALGLAIVPLPLPDHHAFEPLPWPPETPDVIVTEKDAVKLDADAIGATRVWVAPLDFRIEAAFESALAQLLPARPSPRSPRPDPSPFDRSP